MIAAWSLFVSVLLLMLGRGLVGVLAGVRAELEGFDTTVTGVIVASYFVGFLIGSQVTPRIMARVGHIRVFSALSAMIVVAILAQGIWVAPVPWMLLRFLFGFGMVGLVVVAESWLNDTVTNDNRGRVMAIYMVASMGGVAGGQFLLGAGDPSTEILFIVSASLIALAIVPVSLSTSSAPEFKLPPRTNAREIWEAAPIGVVGALFTGMANASLLGMAAVYASQVGMTVERTALFAGAAAVGAVFFAVPDWPHIGHRRPSPDDSGRLVGRGCHRGSRSHRPCRRVGDHRGDVPVWWNVLHHVFACAQPCDRRAATGKGGHCQLDECVSDRSGCDHRSDSGRRCDDRYRSQWVLVDSGVCVQRYRRVLAVPGDRQTDNQGLVAGALYGGAGEVHGDHAVGAKDVEEERIVVKWVGFRGLEPLRADRQRQRQSARFRLRPHHPESDRQDHAHGLQR